MLSDFMISLTIAVALNHEGTKKEWKGGPRAVLPFSAACKYRRITISVSANINILKAKPITFDMGFIHPITPLDLEGKAIIIVR